jgi:hypothetical protein
MMTGPELVIETDPSPEHEINLLYIGALLVLA